MNIRRILVALIVSMTLARDSAAKVSEGPLLEREIIVGPFDLHRKYRSMEGPWTTQVFRIADLIASKRVELPESMVIFVEGNAAGAPSMAGGAAPTDNKGVVGLADAGGAKLDLYWFKGIKLEVLDENDKPLPTAEFICHLNIDLDANLRNKTFLEGERCGNRRLITLTQGQTEFIFPEGFGVPAAGNEPWQLTFQAANRTTDKHRRIKHRATLFFVKDADLVYPIKALHWYAPFVTVVTEKDNPETAAAEIAKSPHCLGMEPGVLAPNGGSASLFKDSLGRMLSGHWVVPPGLHTYTIPISEEREPGFAAQDRRIHAAWTHIHPMCTNVSLMECELPKNRKVYDVKVKTKTKGGLEIMHIDNILSKEGIPLAANRRYELQATYNNTTDAPHDSMVSMGIFFADEKFARPQFCYGEKNPAFCGVIAHRDDTAKVSVANGFPFFDIKRDGPLLTQPKRMTLVTSEGPIQLVLDPTWAPQHATQIYRLLKKGVYDGTRYYLFIPNFIVLLANAEDKVQGQIFSPEKRELLRRLPLEVDSQANVTVAHKKDFLTMSHDDNDPNTAVSSFSILLGNAPHLDKKYTVFGHLVRDEATVRTLEKIEQELSANRYPWIVKVTE